MHDKERKFLFHAFSQTGCMHVLWNPTYVFGFWFCRCECFDLHQDLIPYGDAWSWQKEIVREKMGLIDANLDCPDTLIVLQHHPVYTMGTNGTEEYLNFDLKDSPFPIYRTERGGEVTYHGPGQVLDRSSSHWSKDFIWLFFYIVCLSFYTRIYCFYRVVFVWLNYKKISWILLFEKYSYSFESCKITLRLGYTLRVVSLWSLSQDK